MFSLSTNDFAVEIGGESFFAPTVSFASIRVSRCSRVSVERARMHFYCNARISLYSGHMRVVRARNTRSNKATPRGRRGGVRAALGSRGRGDRDANGRLQVQPVYIARTTDSKRSMVGARARPRTRPTRRSPSISHSIRRPVLRILASTSARLAVCTATREDQFRAGIPLAGSYGLCRLPHSRV